MRQHGVIGGACVVGLAMACWSCGLATAAVFPSNGNGKGEGVAGVGIVPLATTRVASGLDHVVFVTHVPGDYDRLFIVEKQGRIKILNLQSGNVNGTTFLNIDSIVGGGTQTNNEQGLLGLAFHPDYANNGFFYVNYTNTSGHTTIRRYTVSANPDVANVASGFTLLTFSQPFTNHNGGWIGFGPNDGFLYISTGDGGSANDPGNRAQDITNQLLGKMLRIDVDRGNPYAIPPSNPFVGVTGDDEIWAYGLRNPWRCSFDRDTGDLWIADVGQNAWEEINFQSFVSHGGENYGWRCWEGNAAFNQGGCPPSNTMVFPIHVYSHPTGFSLTGGYVYRGCEIPSLDGTYFFADYVTNVIWSLSYDGAVVTNFTNRTGELSPSIEGHTVNQISSFGEDALGEVYIVKQGNGSQGQIFRIIPATIDPADDCNGNDRVDTCEIQSGWAGDCDGNQEIDTCEIAANPDLDCQPNGTLDSCDIESGDSLDENGDGVPDECQPAKSKPPTVSAIGPRYLSITPPAGTDPVALRLTSPDEACIDLYVQAPTMINGKLVSRLGPAPVELTPAAWGDVTLGDTEILPETEYHVEVQPQGGGASSPPGIATTWIWGDTNNSLGTPNFDDVVCALDGFAGVFFGGCSFFGTDLEGTQPNVALDFDDVVAVLDAFAGVAYLDNPSHIDPCP